MRLEFPAKSILFPRNQTVVAWPVIELTIPRPFAIPFRKKVLIDTGATNTIFPLSLAAQLGIVDVEELSSIPMSAGSGGFKGYLAKARMWIDHPENPNSGWEWTGEIVLANVRTSHYGVLGHLGFLEHLDFELRSEEERFTLEENSRFRGITRE